MNDPFVSGEPFEQKQADQLARVFNLAFSSSLLYGGSHQTTVENAGSFHAHLAPFLQGKTGLTLSAARESVFFENWCVDKSVNRKRITGYFKKADLQSITFDPGVPCEEVALLMSMFGDFQESPSAEAMKKALVARMVKKVRLNYVLYKKVTVDEEVVDRGGLAANPNSFGTANGRELLRELSPVFSLKQLFDESKHAVDSLVNRQQGDAEGGLAFVIDRIKTLTAEVQSGAAHKEFPSTDEMIEAVGKLKHDLTLGLEVLKATGRVLVASAPMEEELARLSRETVIRLILDEYQGGGVSLKRLSQIVRRIMPDVHELKKLLPRLKQRLLDAGMPLSDFLRLVQSIIGEMESEDLADILSSASEGMGVSVEEVIGGIKSDPADAARLIILASEIRKGPGADTGQLSTLLTDYVERISQKLAANNSSAVKASGSLDAKTAIRNFEDDLLEKLKNQGLQEPVIKQVRQRLDRKNRSYELPKGIFDIRATMFFLEHEIKLFLRYNAPFSTLLISCVALKKDDGRVYAPTAQEAGEIIPGILKISKKMLRDLDLIGVMGWISENVPFIILPMTDEPGAQCVINRLQTALSKAEFKCGAVPVSPRFLMTSFEFDKIKTPDGASYIRGAAAFHKKRLEMGDREVAR
jgi:hypothetical protein